MQTARLSARFGRRALLKRHGVRERSARTAQELPILALGLLRGASGASEAPAARLRSACTECGFHSVRNHGVPEGLLAEAFAAAERVQDVPLERKLAP